MKCIEKLLDKLKTLHIRIRLRRILKALSIKDLYPWQENYVLHKSYYIPCGRATGKTTAFIIETLLWRKEPIHYWHAMCENPIAQVDPDYFKSPYFHDAELLRCWYKCSDKNISVFPRIRNRTPEGFRQNYRR